MWAHDRPTESIGEGGKGREEGKEGTGKQTAPGITKPGKEEEDEGA